MIGEVSHIQQANILGKSVRVNRCAPCVLCLTIILPTWQEIQATWYEKLHEWEDALVAYDKKMDTNKDDPELMLGRMRCLEALGEW